MPEPGPTGGGPTGGGPTGGGPTGGGPTGGGPNGGGSGAGPRDHHGRRGGDKDKDKRRRRHRYRHDTPVYTTDNNAGPQSVNLQDECDRGYDAGLRTGAKDAREGKSNDPRRSGNYKSGGGGFFKWGRSDAAKQAYRDCFLRGYEEGYRNANATPAGASPLN